LKFTCIVVAAGRGRRARSAANKILVRAGSKPILHYTLRPFAALGECEGIILVANGDDIAQQLLGEDQLRREFRVSRIVEGGERRVDSVRNGLAALEPSVELVAIHDAARPYVRRDTILAVVREAEKHGAAIAAIPTGDTLKEAGPEGFVARTISRKRILQAQTPQAFRRDILEDALAAADKDNITDDAQLVELNNGKVRLVPSRTTNMKITTPEDLVMAVKLLPVWDVEKV
jgi:2-C-methyl-D-erythritol 4-phosphate cytidylyltransferase